MFFIPRLGALKGLYYGIWHSISAFCNAGFDLCGSTSLVAYNTNPIINFIVPFEIIMGGLGFIVVLDIHDKYIKEKKIIKLFVASSIWQLCLTYKDSINDDCIFGCYRNIIILYNGIQQSCNYWKNEFCR